MQPIAIGLGTWPDWIMAVGTVLAVAFAGIAARAGFRANRQQARQLEMLAADQQRLHDEATRLQGSNVAVWWRRAPVPEDSRVVTLPFTS
jgi:hypothetical protein